jgi:hypothetical protein
LNEIAYPLACFLDQYRARIEALLAGGYRVRSEPAPIGVPVEVVTRLDGMIDVHVLHARILIKRCGRSIQGSRESEDNN